MRSGITLLSLGFGILEFLAKFIGLLCGGVGQCHLTETEQRDEGDEVSGGFHLATLSELESRGNVTLAQTTRDGVLLIHFELKHRP